MEFLTSLATIGSLISEGVKLGTLAFGKRSQKFRDLESAFKRVKGQMNDEGERIGKYIEFTRLTADIDRALDAIRKSDRDILDDQQFWDHVGDFQRDLNEFGIAQLRNFNSDMLSEADRQRIQDHSPRLSDHIVRASEQFDQKNRELYRQHLRETVMEIGNLKAVGARILEDIGSKLRIFR